MTAVNGGAEVICFRSVSDWSTLDHLVSTCSDVVVRFHLGGGT